MSRPILIRMIFPKIFLKIKEVLRLSKDLLNLLKRVIITSFRLEVLNLENKYSNLLFIATLVLIVFLPELILNLKLIDYLIISINLTLVANKISIDDQYADHAKKLHRIEKVLSKVSVKSLKYRYYLSVSFSS